MPRLIPRGPRQITSFKDDRRESIQHFRARTKYSRFYRMIVKYEDFLKSVWRMGGRSFILPGLSRLVAARRILKAELHQKIHGNNRYWCRLRIDYGRMVEMMGWVLPDWNSSLRVHHLRQDNLFGSHGSPWQKYEGLSFSLPADHLFLDPPAERLFSSQIPIP